MGSSDAQEQAGEQTAGGLVPEGPGAPDGIPPEIFRAATATFLGMRRLDMRALAAELGMARATLYRKAGPRDRLLGEILWYFTRRAMIDAIDSAAGLRGAERVVATVRGFMEGVHGQPPFQRLLEAEPEIALRVLTSKHGPVQRGIVATLERLLERECERGALALTIEPSVLGYVIVRIGESFLYADVIAGTEPDVGQAVEVVARLLDGASSR